MPSRLILSDVVERIVPSATIAVTTRSDELRRAGRDVVALGSGEPDFDTPNFIRQAAIDAINAGKTKYTPADGLPELKEAVCAKFRRDNSLTYTPQQIHVAPGGKAVIYNALLATLNPGDDVIVPAPYWTSYPEIVRLCAGNPVIVPCGIESGYKLTATALEAAITSRTKWLILNSPANPTGVVYTEGELEALADVLMRYPHVWILSDDIYEHIIYDGLTHKTIASVEPGLHERTLTVNGVSKAYAMTGWRIGYAAGATKLIAAMRKVIGQTTSNPCSISQYAAIAALGGDHDFLTGRNEVFRKRRDFVVAGLNAIDGLDCPNPAGAFYVYPSCAGLIGKTTATGIRIKTDEDFTRLLLEDENVAIVMGQAFGLSPAFRISYAVSDETLRRAMTRIESFCTHLS